MPAQDSPATPGDANDVAPPTYHSDFALRHFVPKLGKSFQTIALLAYMWACVSPWRDKPSLFFAASRLAMLIDDRSSRSRAIKKLIKIGALKRVGKATPSGSRYVLLRPAIWQLSEDLQAQLARVSPRDYRYNAKVALRTDADQPPLKTAKPKKPKRKQPKVERKKLTAYIRTFRLGKEQRRWTWPIVAYLIEKLTGLSRGAVRYTKSAKDVEAFATWLYLNKILPSEFLKLWKLLTAKRESKPTGNELRWVFEDNTPKKSEYLRCVLADLRPSLQALQGDET